MNKITFTSNGKNSGLLPVLSRREEYSIYVSVRKVRRWNLRTEPRRVAH